MKQEGAFTGVINGAPVKCMCSWWSGPSQSGSLPSGSILEYSIPSMSGNPLDVLIELQFIGSESNVCLFSEFQKKKGEK
jgi:hypothetical protein